MGGSSSPTISAPPGLGVNGARARPQVGMRGQRVSDRGTGVSRHTMTNGQQYLVLSERSQAAASGAGWSGVAPGWGVLWPSVLRPLTAQAVVPGARRPDLADAELHKVH